jgi:F0F1-type ATP synthase membrane subunit b/b'
VDKVDKRVEGVRNKVSEHVNTKKDVRQNSADRAGPEKRAKRNHKKNKGKQENAKEERRLTEALFGSQDAIL